MTSPTIQHIQANGLRFAYFEEGAGPLVLLLHGFPDTPHTWDAVRPALAAAGYRAVTPFMRGYAPTEVPRDGAYDADTLGRDAIALIEALGEERAFLVGHDWGASAAYAAAGLAPERLRMLITLAIPHPASILPTPGTLWGVRHFFALSLPGAAARMRADGFAYVDALVRRWSPAWDVPAGGDRSRQGRVPRAGLRGGGGLVLPGAAPVAARVAAQAGARPGGGVRGGDGSDAGVGLRAGAPALRRSLRGGEGARRPLHAPRAPGGRSSPSCCGSSGSRRAA